LRATALLKTHGAFDLHNILRTGVDQAYHSPNGKWTLAAYGRNVTDERYDNARLNLTDYILVILSNDASEFGLRFVTHFGQ